ncbi:MAG: polyhydroxyalkanoic acid system family protein [Rhizobacter sp.]
MTTFQIHRSHALGLESARQLARHWADAAEKEHQMNCTVAEQEDRCRIAFKRPGVHGDLVAKVDDFVLTVTLGFLIAAFGPRIRAEIEKNLDAAIAEASAVSRAGSEG